MNQASLQSGHRRLALWGGVECTVNRVQDRYFNQLEKNGHASRASDLERFASLGIEAIRYPVLWESVAPGSLKEADWSWPDARLAMLRELGIRPIVGLVHHGSGPRHTSLLDPGFATKLAAYAGALAQRYPWVADYTPVNEPLTTARFCGLYGVWYPHCRDDRSFVQALLNQCRAVVLAMRAIREVNPAARLLQTDDLGQSYGTPQLRALADFYNERRWLGWDLLCGKVDRRHVLWDYLSGTGISSSELLWFAENPCAPDMIGLNYYVTSERWLDHRVERYAAHHVGRSGDQYCADLETARVLASPTPGIGPLIEQAWRRYGIPLALTETHIDANREDQLRWLLEIWQAARRAQDDGIELRALTVWALLGSYDWNCLVTENRGYYEPGPFDVRSTPPRPTAVATLMRELAAGRAQSHPVLRGQGWWRRPGRHLYVPVVEAEGAPAAILQPEARELHSMQPILVTGARGTLGRAFARICEARNLAYRLLDRQAMDIADPAAVERAIERWQPWAIINAGGYVRVDEAEADAARCYRENADGPSVLAIACARHKIQLMSFSSDLVFDGRQRSPYVETDPVAPLCVYGKSKAAAEQRVLETCPEALMIRTSAFFGPWDSSNFITMGLQALAAGAPFCAAGDLTISPTFVPDLVHASLDLLVDREKGIWHLTNAEPITWAELARKACVMAGIDAGRLQTRRAAELGYRARRPRFSALHSERALLLPTLDDALARYLSLRAQVASKPGPMMRE